MQNKKWTLFWFQFENVKKAEHAEMSFADLKGIVCCGALYGKK
jgi:hypothetical protein